MSFKNYLDSKIKNRWLAANFKHLPLLFFIYIIFCLFIIIPILIIEGNQLDPSDWATILIYPDVIIVPLFSINGLYLLGKIKFLNKSVLNSLLLKTLTVLIAISIGTVISEYIDSTYNSFIGKTPMDMHTGTQIGYHVLSTIEESLAINIFFGMVIGIPVLILNSRKQSRDLQLQKHELELKNLQQLNVKAQLETLQAKINPHFLYNSLNSIASLAKVDPDKVEQMAIALSKFFRYSTMTSTSNYSTIDKELEMVRTYLEIEKIRFDDRLNYSIDSRVNGNYLIPKFLIQPLVENSMKHGLSKIVKQAVLKVNLIEVDHQIEISIHDNGPDFPDDLLQGFGLQSTYEKLNLLFPHQYAIQFINGNEKRIIITIKNLITNEPSI